MTEVLVRTPRDRKAYRLRCRFQIDAAPSGDYQRVAWLRELEDAKFRAAAMFVADMRKQGWEHEERFGFEMTGPFPVTVTVELPSPKDEPWHAPSRELMDAIAAGYRPASQPAAGHAMNVPLLDETDGWEFELRAVFTRPELLTEIPDAHEEREMS